MSNSDTEICDGSSRLLPPSFILELAGFLIVDSRHGSIDRVNYVFMVTSVTPSIEQYMPPAQARAEYRSAYVTLDPVAYLSSTTLVTQLAKQTHASPNVAITNGTDSYHRNHQYSVTAITTSTGAIAERYAYTAYGQPTILDPSGTVLQTSNFSLRYSFTGREWDATLALHHFRARWMSPSAGRFLGRDPIEFRAGPNFYRLGMALSLTDPRGLSPASLRLCEIEKAKIEGRVKALCGKNDFSIECNDKCDKSIAASGITSCSMGKSKKSIKVTVCTNISSNVKETLDHEVQHGRDFCDCKDCSLNHHDPGESIKDYCEDLLCLEVRGIIAGNNCGYAVGDDAKKRCIRSYLDWYKADYKCPSANIDAVIERCYVPVGETMPDYPYRDRHVPITPEDMADFVNSFCRNACVKHLLNNFPDGPEPPTEEFNKCMARCISGAFK